jgi:hypothetical protein
MFKNSVAFAGLFCKLFKAKKKENLVFLRVKSKQFSLMVSDLFKECMKCFREVRADSDSYKINEKFQQLK